MVTPLPIQLANLGMADSLILMVMALVVFGPRRLPQIGRQIGKLMYEFRKASNDFKFQMEEELRMSEDADRRKNEEAERTRVAALAASNPTPAEDVVSVQTVEAQADIGASEASIAEPYIPSVTEAASTPVGEAFAEIVPEPASPPDPAAEPAPEAARALPRVSPRIQPPWVGEQVEAARPNSLSGAEPDPMTGPKPSSETESEPATTSEAPTPPTETVSQHG